MWTYKKGFSLRQTVALLLALALPAVAQVSRSLATLRVATEDQSNRSVAGVTVELKLAGTVVTSAQTNEKGEVEFTKLTPGTYEVVIGKQGFETLTRNEIAISAGTPVQLKFTLVPKIELKDSVTIEGGGTTRTRESVVPAGEFGRGQLYDLANKPSNVADALPLVPGVVRTGDGEISISGSGEHRSALVVNSADVTDPATGQFGMTIPVDSVEAVEVFKSPFVAQYGRFTAGVVAVETRRGGEKWNFDVHDPLPVFRFRSGHMAGLLNATPRIVFNGPLIKNKLFLSEGVEYRLVKDVVRTLPHPNRESKSESVNSFTQLDYLFSPEHTLTGTLHIAPRKELFANLNFFDPRPVSPSFSARDYTGTFIDRLSIGNHLLESTFAVKKYGSDVWGQGRAKMVLSPTGNRGNYWSEQSRDASRFEWIEQFTPGAINWFGTHNLRFGALLTETRYRGQFTARPVDIEDTNGRVLRHIDFAGGRQFEPGDTELTFYAQNHWILNSRLAIDVGTRVERQQVSGSLRTAPRLGFAWSPFGRADTVVRGGVGVFYDRLPLSIYAFGRYPEQVVTTYGPDGALTDGPRQFANVTGRTGHRFPLVRYADKPGNFAPHSTTWNIELDKTFGRFVRMRANYMQSQSGGLAIVSPGLFNGRDALLLSGDGSSRFRQFEITAKVVWSDQENLVLSYVRSRARGDLNEFNERLGNFPFPVVRPNEYSNLGADLPNRFLAYGLVKLPWRMRFAPLIEYRNGFPFAVIGALQQYVGQPNSDKTRFPNFYSFDLRLMKDFDVSYRNKKYTVRIAFDGYNVTNHFNPWDVHRNVADPQFGVFFGRYRRWFKVDFDIFF